MSYLTRALDNNKLPLKNRLVLPPMATAKSDKKGELKQELLDYYDEKTQGGYISLVIIEHSFISQQGKASEGQLSAADDDRIAGLKKLAETIHKNNSKAVMQINHAGSAASSEITGKEIVAPSAVVHPNGKEVPKKLSYKEIQIIINDFKEAARRVKEAGFDGVEIHSAHSYLLNQFYSPITNQREDEYGGDLAGRIKIHLEVIEAVRKEVGEDFPILMRLGASDYMEGGITLEESLKAAPKLEAAGVNILDISGGLCGYSAQGLEGQGYFSELTEPIKEVVSIPVILTGGITEAEAAKKLLAEEKADLIGVGRAILNDSNWPRKAIQSLK
ncbi:MAG: NADH:flavin oxidoreductase [Halanaerobium sp.]